MFFIEYDVGKGNLEFRNPGPLDPLKYINNLGEAEFAGCALLEKDSLGGFEQTGLKMCLFSGAGKSSLGNVLLGRAHNFVEDSDVNCFVAGAGADPSTKDTCAQEGRFGMRQNTQF